MIQMAAAMVTLLVGVLYAAEGTENTIWVDELDLSLATSGVGVNLWHNGEDMDLVAATGAKFVRMNLSWTAVDGGIESPTNLYHFDTSGDDAFVAACQARGIRVLYNFFGNNYYWNPDTFVYYQMFDSDAWRTAYANYAGATAAHFAGKGMVYELWNEPDGYAHGAEDIGTYMRFVSSVSAAIRAADPTAAIIGPAVNDNGGTTFLTDCIDRGLLDKVDAISLHPYANPPWNVPENVVDRYAAVRNLMQTHGGKTLPIVSSEWGYCTPAVSGNEELQGDYLARSMLVNLSQGIPLSIWYEFRDRSMTGNEWEDNYGMVAHDDVTGAQTGLRPAFDRMQELTTALQGKAFSERLDIGNNADWLLVFKIPETGCETLAAWTTGNAHTVTLPEWGEVSLSSTPVFLQLHQYFNADINRDCYVDVEDIVIFAQDWLKCNDPQNEMDCP